MGAQALMDHKVLLEGTLLKPNMVTAGALLASRFSHALPLRVLMAQAVRSVGAELEGGLGVSCNAWTCPHAFWPHGSNDTQVLIPLTNATPSRNSTASVDLSGWRKSNATRLCTGRDWPQPDPHICRNLQSLTVDQLTCEYLRPPTSVNICNP